MKYRTNMVTSHCPYTTLFRSGGRAAPGNRGCSSRRANAQTFAHSGFPAPSQPPPAFRPCAWKTQCDPRSTGEPTRSEEHTSELQSLTNIVCRLLLEKKNYTEI